MTWTSRLFLKDGGMIRQSCNVERQPCSARCTASILSPNNGTSIPFEYCFCLQGVMGFKMTHFEPRYVLLLPANNVVSENSAGNNICWNLIISVDVIFALLTEVYSEPCQISKMERFMKTIKDFRQVTMAKRSILDLWEGSWNDSG